MRSRVTGFFGASSGSPSNVTIVGPSPLPVSVQGGLDVKKAEIHDISATNINASGGAFVALGSGAALGSIIQKLQLSYTAGEPLEFGVGASAGAATRKWVANQGEGPMLLDILLAAADKVWVRSLSLNAVSSGYITTNFLG